MTSGRKSRETAAKRNLAATAYHEAGHAVAALYNRIGVDSVTILPDAKAGSLGRVRERHGRNRAIWSGEAHLEEFVAYAAYILAGPQAEKRYTGRRNHLGATGDYAQIRELALRYAGGVEAANLLVQLAALNANALLAAEWTSVEAVAAALLERSTLDGAALQAVVFSAVRPGGNHVEDQPGSVDTLPSN